MWAKLDDRFHTHPKTLNMSDKAFRLFVSSLTYSGEHKLGGRLNATHFRALLVIVKANQKHVDELVSLQSWEKDGDDYVIHNYDRYNAESVSEKRREAGRIGGQNRAESASKTQAKLKQNSSKTQANAQAKLKQNSSKCLDFASAGARAADSLPLPTKADSRLPTPDSPLTPQPAATGYPPREAVDIELLKSGCSEAEIEAAWEEWDARPLARKPPGFADAGRMARYVLKIIAGLRTGEVRSGAPPGPSLDAEVDALYAKWKAEENAQ